MARAPRLLECRVCGGKVAATAPSCPHCGYRPEGAAPDSSLSVLGLVMGLAGVIVAVGACLPWATVAGVISVGGLDHGEDGLITLVVGVALLLVAGVELGSRGLGLVSHVGAALGGLTAIGVGVIDLTRTNSSGLVSAGPGIYLVILGGGLAATAAILAPSRRS